MLLTHGVFPQQVFFGLSFAAVDRPESAEQRPPPRQDLWRAHLHQLSDRRHHLVLHVLVAQLQLHDVLERPEERLVEVEVRELRPAGQHLRQDVVEEGHGFLGHVPLFVTRSLRKIHNGWEEVVQKKKAL